MEHTLNIQITVTDEQMSSLINGRLEDLPDEKVYEILSDSLRVFLQSKEGQELFYKKSYYDNDAHPTELLNRMISNAVSKDLLKPCVDEFISHLQNNYKELIIESMVQTFSNMFLDNVTKDTFKSTITNILHNVMK